MSTHCPFNVLICIVRPMVEINCLYTVWAQNRYFKFVDYHLTTIILLQIVDDFPIENVQWIYPTKFLLSLTIYWNVSQNGSLW